MIDYSKKCQDIKTEAEVSALLSNLPEAIRNAAMANAGGYRVGEEKFYSMKSIDKYIKSLWQSEEPKTVKKTTSEGTGAIKAKEAEIGKLNDDIGKLNADLESTRRKLDEKTEEVRKYKDQIREHIRQNDALTKKLDEQGTDNPQADPAELKSLKDRLSSAETELENSRKSVTAKDAEIGRNEKVLAEYRRNLADTEKELAGLKAKAEETESERDVLNAKVFELEKALKNRPTAEPAGPKAELKKRIKELEKELAETRSGLAESDEKCHSLEKELSDIENSASLKELQKAKADIETWKNLADEYLTVADSKDVEIRGLLEKSKQMKTDMETMNHKVAGLQASLDAKKNQKEDNGGTALDGIDLFYPEELGDFIGMLARERMDRIADASDTRKREYDLAKALSERFVDSGYQDAFKSRLDKAGKEACNGRFRDMFRCGFEEDTTSNGSHRKFIYKGHTRYTAIVAVTPSDICAGRNCSGELRNMLTFGKEKK